MQMKRDSHSDDEIKRIYDMKNVAVVGMSNTEGKAANYVPRYLIEQGYNVIPVNPTTPAIMGKTSYSMVSIVPEGIDIVDVFRPSEEIATVVRDALKKEGIKVIWMQEGLYNEEAERMAREKGVDVVYNRCMMAEHMRLFNMD